jgi:hypothetical protein
MEDLAPYSCFLEDCQQADKLFSRREDWVAHLLDEYKKCWPCRPCEGSGTDPHIFGSQELFHDHVESKHGLEITNLRREWFSDYVARLVPAGNGQCPLCDFTGPMDSNPFLDHVAKHMREFSLRSIPWSECEEQWVDDNGGDSFDQTDWSDSGLEDGSTPGGLESSWLLVAI